MLQTNIDGAVTSADASAIDGEIVVMSGATGKVIKSSKVNISALNNAIAKVHEHANKVKLDTYDKTQTELLTAASTDAQSKVDALKVTVDKKADKINYPNIDIYNPEIIKRLEYDIIVIAVARKEVYEQIKMELIDMKVDSQKILWITPGNCKCYLNE